MPPNVLKIGVGDAASAVADSQKAVVSFDEWESFEEHGIRHGKHSGVDAYAESKHRDGDRCKARILERSPKT